MGYGVVVMDKADMQQICVFEDDKVEISGQGTIAEFRAKSSLPGDYSVEGEIRMSSFDRNRLGQSVAGHSVPAIVGSKVIVRKSTPTVTSHLDGEAHHIPTTVTQPMSMRIDDSRSELIHMNEILIDESDMKELGVVKGDVVELTGWGTVAEYHVSPQKIHSTKGTIRINDLNRRSLGWSRTDGRVGRKFEVPIGNNVMVRKSTRMTEASQGAREGSISQPGSAQLAVERGPAKLCTNLDCRRDFPENRLPLEAKYCDKCGSELR